MTRRERVLVTGAGGFIGGHLVRRLKQDGFWVKGVDIKYPEFRETVADVWARMDLRTASSCDIALQTWDETDKCFKTPDIVYNLAADMGGMGYIGTVMASITHNNVLINANMLEACRRAKVKKFFFSSSACVYPSFHQDAEVNTALVESIAIPADPEPGYGWEKLFTEQLCSYYKRDCGMDTKVARFHNVYGPYGTYDGGREKFPAAICRKIALAKDGDTIEVWGDGEQTRTFLYVDDCVEGIRRLMESDFSGPVNIGSSRLISVNDTVDMVCKLAGKKLKRKHLLDKPMGVRGRSSDNTLIKEKLNWEPKVTLEAGFNETYNWICSEVAKEAKCV